MRLASKLVGVAGLVVGLAACGGSLSPNPDGGGGSGGSAGSGSAGTTGNAGTTWTGGSTPCSAMGGCDCIAAFDRCTPRSEACWCPTECYPGSECVCGGGRFLACEDKTVVATCATELAAVQAFVGDLSALCDAAANPTCVAACLANLHNTGSCSEIDCSFCQACDCLSPATPSPFAACLRACVPPPLPL